MMGIRPEKAGVRNRDHERGMILAVATIVVIAMLVMATPFLFKLSMQSRTTEKSNRSLAAFNLAEGGVDRALWEMNQPYAVSGGIVAVDEEGNGTLALTYEEVGDRTGTIQGTIMTNLGVEPNVRTIVATGGVPHIAGQPVTRTVGVNLEKYYKSVFDFGIFADEGIWGKTNIKTDSFNSNDGAYGGSLAGGGVNKGHNGHAGTNATGDAAIEIAQGSSSEIHGNLAAGTGTDPDSLTDVISIPSESIFKEGGERMIMSAEFEMPQVDLWDLPPRDMFGTELDFHDWFSSQPPVDGPLPSDIINPGFDKGALSSSKTVLTPADSGVYTSFNLAKNKSLTVQGNVAIYVTGLDGATGSFEPLKNSSITIGENSSLTLILGKTSSVNVINNCQINNTQTAADLLVLGTSQFTGNFGLRNNDTIKAAIYMPNASFVVDQANVDLYGAVVCDYIDIRNNVDLHYDEALKQLSYVKGGIPYWRVTTWQERVGD